MEKESSLNLTIKKTRTIVMVFVGIIVVIFLLQICLSTLSNLGRRQTPNTGDNGNTTRFSNLQLPAPDNALVSKLSSINVSTDLDFIDEKMSANVFKISSGNVSFGNEDIAKGTAASLEFTTNPINNSDVLSWRESTKKFEFDLKNKSSIYQNNSLPTNTSSTSGASENILTRPILNADSLISSFNADHKIFVESKIQVSDETSLVFTRGTMNNQIITTDFTNADYLALKKYYLLPLPNDKTNNDTEQSIEYRGRLYHKNYYGASLSYQFSAKQDETEITALEKLLDMKVTNFEIESALDYELLPPSVAWQNLLGGKGGIFEIKEFGSRKFEPGNNSLSELTGVTLKVSDTKIDYLEVTSTNERYLVPIYVFSGRSRTTSSPGIDNSEFLAWSWAI